jgi:hypothetical protein
MTKVFFFGNSHLAAIKLGYDRLRDEFPRIEATFFGMRGNVLHQVISMEGSILRIDRSASPKLMFSTSPGCYEFDLATFDSFVLCGLNLNVFRLLPLIETHVPDDFHMPKGGCQLVSSACFAKMSVAAGRSGQAFRRSREIEARLNRRVVVIPEPLPAGIGRNHEKFQPLERLLGTGNEGAMARYFDVMLEGFATPGIAVVKQPKETLRSPLLTLPEFTRDAKRLRSELASDHGEDEVLHMNGEFGAIMLREGLKHILH